MEEQQKCKCPAGIPAWVLTFADLMSLLMCFFVLLLSFAEMDVLKFKQIAGSMKMAFGVQRDIKAVEIPKGVNIVAKEFSPAPPQPTVINEVRQVTSDDTQQELKLIEKLEQLQSEENVLKDKMENMSEAEAESEGLKKQLRELLVEKAEVEKELSDLQEKMDQVQEKQIKEKAEILSSALQSEIEAEMIDVESNESSITIRIRDKGSFASGTATLTEDFIEILEIIAEELSKTSGNIIVAGHTDDIPISTARFRSNWALSSARSVAVAHELLLDDRLDKLRFSIQAFADAKPLVDNDSSENRAKNRRVEIIISQGKDDLGITPDKVKLPDTDLPDHNEKVNNTVNKAGGKEKKPVNSSNVKQSQKNNSNQQQISTGADKPVSTKVRGTGANNKGDDAFVPEADNTEEAPSFIQF
ncbi:MAG: OmpA family protein [gamma proteobacterium symbiont of Bathyaustriella thionipta]|nr:OmpA family protein [gamma proteobacterium symbiont of Bathyaustriella thionipta]MCU7950645.1 OmpA family protein [gamma proteobacterium symbiont of Bathyaustriella thionipta]MCU7952597.1 OmpA family protein [gamma proteobacterium symbiont of Bathyaustriella thionipta]MCU7957764.1 OmpA family protein [gamma proteobacterium symbiont of Bathyaustriella thionipta]MCU7968549.1 OmpA family protein [gamma proteobacterium symbiont of Bathyaustriella thionipta]